MKPWPGSRLGCRVGIPSSCWNCAKFGGGRSTGFALIYDSLDARKKFDSKKMLRRVSDRPRLAWKVSQ